MEHTEYSVSEAQANLRASKQLQRDSPYAYEPVRTRTGDDAFLYPPPATDGYGHSIASTTVNAASPSGAAHNSFSVSVPTFTAEQLQLLDSQKRAVTQWSRRVKGCFAVHFLLALCLLHSYYWFTTVVGVVLLIALGLYSYLIKLQQTNFVLLYVIIVAINFIKNIIILSFYLEEAKSSRLTAYEYFLVIFLFGDCLLLTPTSLYSCFFLHRSISLTHLTF